MKSITAIEKQKKHIAFLYLYPQAHMTVIEKEEKKLKEMEVNKNAN